MIRTVVIALAMTTALFLSACGEDNPEKTESGAKQEIKAEAATDKVSGTQTTGPDSAPAPESRPTSVPATDVEPQSMTPTGLASMCEQCHDKDDVARYEETFLPLYTMMFRPAPWADPNVYFNNMRPIMDPETYTRWYNQWVRVMGGPVAPGDEK